MKTEQQINSLTQLNEDLKANGMKKYNVKREISALKLKLAKVEKELLIKKIEAENQIYKGSNASEYKNETARQNAVKALLEIDETYNKLLTDKDFYLEEINLAELRLTLYRIDYKYTDNQIKILLLA